jgi:hypothetical protein
VCVCVFLGKLIRVSGLIHGIVVVVVRILFFFLVLDLIFC